LVTTFKPCSRLKPLLQKQQKGFLCASVVNKVFIARVQRV
jgi:hypothetical protein